MQQACLLGTGLNCALGTTLAECVDGLHGDAMPMGTIALDDFKDPIRAAYYRMTDDAQLLDPGRLTRLLPPVVEAVLAQAKLTSEQRRDLPILVGSSSFFIARSEGRYAKALHEQPETAIPMGDIEVGFDAITSLVARIVGSRGKRMTWNTACSSSANALLAAQRMISAGRFDRVLVIGVELANRITVSGFSGLQLLADAVRPFDVQRQGMVLGEAIGAVVLGAGSDDEKLRLVGGAANCDVYSATGANPDGSSFAAVQARALRQTGLRPEQLRAIKVHGTGSLTNDLGEARGMRRVFSQLPPLCALKPRLGHTLGACGVAEFVLFAGALVDGFLPATPGVGTPDPELGVSPLKAAMPGAPGSYLLNQFGFGGGNTSLVLEYG